MRKARTRLEEEKFIKKEQAQAEEVLDYITQEDEAKAADAIIELNQEAEKKAKEDEIKKVEALERSRQWTKAEYIKRLAETLNQLCVHMDLPPAWYYWIGFNKEKLYLSVTDPSGKKFARGIIPTGATTYDFHALGVLVTQAENTVDKLEKRGAYSESKIIIPK
jgi:hypothetical protein